MGRSKAKLSRDMQQSCPKKRGELHACARVHAGKHTLTLGPGYGTEAGRDEAQRRAGMRVEASWDGRRGAGMLTLLRDHCVSFADDGLDEGFHSRSRLCNRLRGGQ